METTLLWESSQEERLKDAIVFGKPAWAYTESLLEAVDGQYRSPAPEDHQLLSMMRENRGFSVSDPAMPEMPVLYFVGHYPALPKELFLEFWHVAQTAKTAVLYGLSQRWAGEREIICLYWGGSRSDSEAAGHVEKTLAFSLERLNSRAQIPLIEATLRQNRNRELIRSGVCIPDPLSVWIDSAVEIAGGTVVHPGSRILGNSVIAEGCRIGPYTEIRDTVIGKNNTIVQSHIDSSRIAEDCNIGPFSYIRPDSVIGSRVRIGDFVEIKNSVIGDDTMISHLTYVGDADVGKQVNFGCGTVLVNFDGIKKHRSIIEDQAFIGCNSNLVSPVHIGKSAFIAAGSTITRDLPQESLGIARARQDIKENWVTYRNKLLKEAKKNEQS